MIISLPNNHHQEREYVLSVLLDDTLGLEYQIVYVQDATATVIEFTAEKKLILQDHFFNQHIEILSYLSIENIPSSLLIIKKEDNPFAEGIDIPFPFGDSKLIVSDNTIICGFDIFASAFYFLSRWEEYVLSHRDKHLRFSPEYSWAGKYHLLSRPLVDEYVEMCWRMFCHLGIDQSRRILNFSAIITHDVDEPFFYKNNINLIKRLGGDLIKRKSWKDVKRTVHYGALYKLTCRKDVFDTFDYIMEVSEKNNQISHFNFMSGGITNYDNKYRFSDIGVEKLLFKILDRGHKVGFHPSYAAYNNKDLFTHELKLLQTISSGEVKSGRQHYLRFEVPFTWRLWEMHNLNWESTISYASIPSFRAGTCRPFSPFDFLLRRKIAITEIPLSFMEVTYFNYLKYNMDEIKKSVQELINTIKYYQGTFVLLWHNSSFYPPDNKKLKEIYEWIIRELSDKTSIYIL